MKFTDYAKEQGCSLLRDDIKFMKAIVRKIPREARKRVLCDYIDIWVSTMQECENALQRQNAGRQAANLHVLGVVDDAKRYS